MVRKLSLICAVAGALLFPITTFAGEGDNHHHQNDQDQRHSERHDHDQDHWRDHDHDRHDHVRYHDRDHGHARHWYHGRYWDYGIGPCWQPTPVGFVWVCGY